MSSSHAPSDSMLTNEAERASQEVLSPRIRTPLNVKKIIRIAGVAFAGIVFIGSLATIAVMATQLSDLTIRVNSLDAAFRSGQIGQLAASVSAQESRFKDMEAEVKLLLANQGNQGSEISRLSDENQAIKTQAAGLISRVDALQSSLASAEDRFSRIESELSKSAAAMSELSRQSFQKVSSPPLNVEKTSTSRSTSIRSQASPAKKASRSAGRIAAPVAPFSLTGIERRGGHTFAVIIPSGVTAISQMKLLSQGDSTQGWILQAISGNEAVFTFNGAERRLSVQ